MVLKMRLRTNAPCDIGICRCPETSCEEKSRSVCALSLRVDSLSALGGISIMQERNSDVRVYPTTAFFVRKEISRC